MQSQKLKLIRKGSIEMIFGISPLFALIPLVLYIVLAFRDIHPVLNVVICVVIAAIMTKQIWAGFWRNRSVPSSA